MIIPDTDTDTDTSVDVVQDVMHQHLQQILHVYYCTQGVTETGNTHKAHRDTEMWCRM